MKKAGFSQSLCTRSIRKVRFPARNSGAVFVAIALLVVLPGGGCFRCEASDFYRVTPGAGSAAMGNTGVSRPGYHSVFLNPAGLAFLERGGGMFGYVGHFEDVSFGHAAAAAPFSRGCAGLSLLAMDIPEFRGYDELGFETRYLKSSGYSASAVIALTSKRQKMRKHGIAAGASVKYVSERLDRERLDRVMGDIGVMYAGKNPAGPSAGITAMNLSGTMREYELRGGVSFYPEILGIKTVFSIEGVLPGDKNPAAAARNAGLELRVADALSLRAGAVSGPRGDSSVSAAYGIALILPQFTFEYAGNANGALSDTHRISVIVPFAAAEDDTTAEESFEKGMELYGEERFAEAMMEFNRALGKDPLNQEALEMMKKSSEHIK
jgi:hypothetical protein